MNRFLQLRAWMAKAPSQSGRCFFGPRARGALQRSASCAGLGIWQIKLPEVEIPLGPRLTGALATPGHDECQQRAGYDDDPDHELNRAHIEKAVHRLRQPCSQCSPTGLGQAVCNPARASALDPASLHHSQQTARSCRFEEHRRLPLAAEQPLQQLPLSHVWQQRVLRPPPHFPFDIQLVCLSITLNTSIASPSVQPAEAR